MAIDFEPLLLTLRISLITTPILFLLCVPLAFWLSRARPSLRFPMQALVNLPLVLPPTVIGFYLLLFFSPDWIPGRVLKSWFDVTIPFTQAGLVIGSILFSLPFMVNPILSGLESLPPALSEEAQMLGASKWQTLFHVLLPDIKPSLLAAAVLTFSHTMGEFGVALMIGGKIPGKTLMASMVVYDEVESLRYGTAHVYAAALCALSFTALLSLFIINRKWYRSV
jgi:molybdate transport system permease protein